MNNGHKVPLTLSMFITQPGHFFCPGGDIIRSELVCNGVSDCDVNVGYEELREICRSLVEPLQNPDSQSLDNIDIKAFVSILKILDISQEKSTFTLYFWLRLQWFNPTLEFYFLKGNYQLNKIYTSNVTTLLYFTDYD